ncbi:MAG: glycerophosphoryl diester phosphodiesterase [Azospirillum sp.]|nr:glycerophosphoryl diester phosphodiesterase [Azospirillum sp.]
MPLRLPPVIGHRGARASAPENTLAGIAAAAAQGVGWVEVDVRLTRDGTAVLMHDPRIDRTTDRLGALSELDWSDLAGCDAGSGFAASFAGEPIPTLVAALALARDLGLGVNLELKASSDDKAAVITAVRGAIAAREQAPDRSPDRSPLPPILVSSFDPDLLAAARDQAPDLPRGLLRADLAADWQAVAAAVEPSAIIVDHLRLGPEAVAAIRATGRLALAYTVNDADRARLLYGWGVTAVISDVPALLLPVLASHAEK